MENYEEIIKIKIDTASLEETIKSAVVLVKEALDEIDASLNGLDISSDSLTNTMSNISSVLGIFASGLTLITMNSSAFATTVGFGTIAIEIGRSIQVDLRITTFLGWLVLASLSVNECRSIIENFVEAGYKVPTILIKGLEIADKMINEEGEKHI